MQTDELLKIVNATLGEHKGEFITTIDVQGKTSFTDYMVIVTGTSQRHVKALCDHVLEKVKEKVKEKGFKPLGREDGEGAEWVLLDLGDVILHVMTAQMREFYQLEKLWSADFPESETVEQVG